MNNFFITIVSYYGIACQVYGKISKKRLINSINIEFLLQRFIDSVIFAMQSKMIAMSKIISGFSKQTKEEKIITQKLDPSKRAQYTGRVCSTIQKDELLELRKKLKNVN